MWDRDEKWWKWRRKGSKESHEGMDQILKVGIGRGFLWSSVGEEV